MGLQKLAFEDAVRVAHRRLFGDDSVKDGQFELLRATVWGLANPPVAVHIKSVLGSAIPFWRVLSGRAEAGDETLRLELREALKALQDAGDLVRIGGGYWTPASSRLVQLSEDAGYLLVGGVPTSMLSVESGEVEYQGPYRFIASPSERLRELLSAESLESWARLPDPNVSLSDWAQELTDSLERRQDTGLNSSEIEFYRPEQAKPDTPQFKRWLKEPGAGRTKLARLTRIFGRHDYRLVEVQAGHVTGASDPLGSDYRRLMYALDQAAGTSVRGYVHTDSEWVFTSELPRAEQRFFATLGTLVIPPERLFERRWTILRNEELASKLVRWLGVELLLASRKVRK